MGLVSRPEMATIIEEAALHLGVGAGSNALLRGFATLLFMIAENETSIPGRLPLSVVKSAFDASVEYLALAATKQGEIK